MAHSILLNPSEIKDHFHQQRLLTRPEVHRMSKLDELISETLSRTDITDNEKYELYNAALADFRKVQNIVLKHGPTMNPQPDFSTFVGPDQNTHSSFPEDLINSLALAMHKMKEEGEEKLKKMNNQKKNL